MDFPRARARSGGGGVRVGFGGGHQRRGCCEVRPGTKNTAEKRKKELDRQKWQAQKAERRQQRQQERQERGSLDSDEDPDLVGIVPGPQPVEEAPAAPIPETPAVEPPK